MSDKLQFEFDWIGSDNAAARAGLAALAICVNGQALTELEDIYAKTVRRTARLSAHDLAFWFAANWWRLRWEPQRETLDWNMSHQVAAIGGGYAWPDITLSSDGQFINIVTHPTAAWPGSPVRYLHASEAIITASEFEQSIDRYIEAVIERQNAFKHNGSPLPALWAELNAERNTPVQTAWRKLEALMGYDPDEAPAGLIDTLQGMETSIGHQAVEEIAAASQNNAPDHIKTLLEQQTQAIRTHIPGRDRLRQKISPLSSPLSNNAPPWQQAAQAAKQVRAEWAIHAHAPISNNTLGDILNLSSGQLSDSDSTAPCHPMAAGFRQLSGENALHIVLTKRRATGKRFELARLLGDDLAAPASENLLPATHTKTIRQKFQRAFAQELLCPHVALAEFLKASIANDADDELLEEAAAHFQVSPLLVKTTLINHGSHPLNTLAPSIQ